MHDFVIIAKGKHIGAAGIRIIEQHPHICNVGYFVDRAYWNKGIATKAVGLLEDYIAKKLKGVVRIEIITAKGNIPSQKVALKHGYKKEGIMRSYLKVGEKIHDCYLFAKILK